MLIFIHFNAVRLSLFKRAFLFILILFLGLSGCEIFQAEEEFEYSTGVFGTIANTNISYYEEHFDIAVIKVTVDGESKEYTLENKNYYNFRVEHNGTFDIEVTTPNLPGYDPYKKTITHKSNNSLEHNVKLTSDVYKYYLSFQYSDVTEYVKYTKISDFSLESDNMGLISKDSTFVEYLVNDCFSYTFSASGYHPRTFSYDIADLKISDYGDYYHLSHKTYLYPNEYSNKTTISGYVYYANTSLPAKDVEVGRSDDFTSYVYTDENGYYSIDFIHNGSFKVFAYKERYVTDNKEISTVESSLTQVFNLYIAEIWEVAEGKVTDKTTGLPIAGATLTLGWYSTKTDADGNFSKLYYDRNKSDTITISAEGYKTLTQDIDYYTETFDYSLEAN